MRITLEPSGENLKPLDINAGIGELHAAGTVGIHLPQLSLAEESNALSALYPCCVGLALGISGQRPGLCHVLLGLGRLDEEHGVANILLHTIV